MSAPTPYLVSITVDQVFDALGAFLAPFVAPVPIIRAQVNRVALPVGNFVELTEIGTCDLEFPRIGYDSVNFQQDFVGPKRIMIQADFYGDQAGDWCAAVKTVWKTPYAVSQFPFGVAPLYCDDGHESPLITGEEQYERRWTLTMSLQYNPILAVPLQSADQLAMHIIDTVDV